MECSFLGVFSAPQSILLKRAEVASFALCDRSVSHFSGNTLEERFLFSQFVFIRECRQCNRRKVSLDLWSSNQNKRARALCVCVSHLNLRPQIKRDYPLNLSILISGGRESNCDSLSSGERSGKSSDLKSGAGIRIRIVAFGCTIAVVSVRGESSLE